MELREFVSESLSQILNGIEDAHKKLDMSRHYPALYHVGQTRNNHFDENDKIHFEVLVNVENSKSGTGGGKINVMALNIGAEGAIETKESQQNRIKFSVPVCFSKTEPSLKEGKGE